MLHGGRRHWQLHASATAPPFIPERLRYRARGAVAFLAPLAREARRPMQLPMVHGGTFPRVISQGSNPRRLSHRID